MSPEIKLRHLNRNTEVVFKYKPIDELLLRPFELVIIVPKSIWELCTAKQYVVVGIRCGEYCNLWLNESENVLW